MYHATVLQTDDPLYPFRMWFFGWAAADTWLVVFYACQIGGDPYDYRYNRIRYMKRPLPRLEGAPRN